MEQTWATAQTGQTKNPREAGILRILAKYPEVTIKSGQGGVGWAGAGPEFIQMNS